MLGLTNILRLFALACVCTYWLVFIDEVTAQDYKDKSQSDDMDLTNNNDNQGSDYDWVGSDPVEEVRLKVDPKYYYPRRRENRNQQLSHKKRHGGHKDRGKHIENYQSMWQTADEPVNIFEDMVRKMTQDYTKKKQTKNARGDHFRFQAAIESPENQPSPKCHSANKCKGQKGDLSSKLEHALPLLEKISDEIEQTKEEATHHLRNDFPCSIDGQWTSKVGGVNLRLQTHGDGKINVTVNMTDAPEEGELHNCAWHVSGLVPSKRQGPFALAAVCAHQHRIAVFIGQCKVCEDVETIFGNWMFSRISRDCSEAMSSVVSKSDVWRKYRLDEAKDMKKWQDAESSPKNKTCATATMPSETQEDDES